MEPVGMLLFFEKKKVYMLFLTKTGMKIGFQAPFMLLKF